MSVERTHSLRGAVRASWRVSLAGLWRSCGWRLDRSARRGTGSNIPPMLTDCSRDLLRGTGTRETGRDGTAASVLLSLDPPIREWGGWFPDAAHGAACGGSR